MKKEKLELKNTLNKGITLIALVVTIIILLILAGITIAFAFGENGLIGKAQNAKNKYKISEIQEEIELVITNELIAEKEEGRAFSYENVWRELRKNDTNLQVIERENYYEIQYKGYKFKIDENKKVTYISGTVEIEESEYKIVYHKNDGSMEKIEQISQIGKEVTIEKNKFTKGGYELVGWYKTADCTGEEITKANDNIELYAKWEVKKTIESLGAVTINHVNYSESYEIWNKEQLEYLRDKVNAGETYSGAIIRQKENINLNKEEWTPIGDVNNNKPFSGTYDAEERIIENLKISNQTNYQGLFGYVKNGTIENIQVQGEVKGGSGTAGIVGGIESGTIKNATNKVNVKHSGRI